MTENCGNCRFFKEGKCHFMPPLILYSHNVVPFHPSVSGLNWCGQWQPQDSSKIEPTVKENLTVEKPSREKIYRQALDEILEIVYFHTEDVESILLKVINLTEKTLGEAEKL